MRSEPPTVTSTVRVQPTKTRHTYLILDPTSRSTAKERHSYLQVGRGWRSLSTSGEKRTLKPFVFSSLFIVWYTHRGFTYTNGVPSTVRPHWTTGSLVTSTVQTLDRVTGLKRGRRFGRTPNVQLGLVRIAPLRPERGGTLTSRTTVVVKKTCT